jgi:hypothetical protein
MPRSLQLRQTVTLHRDTSIRPGESEVSRQVWTSLAHPLAPALAVNLSRAKGAAASLALGVLNQKREAA